MSLFYGRYIVPLSQTNFVIRLSKFIGNNFVYIGSGGAISIEGNLNLTKSSFEDYAVTEEGGCVYLTKPDSNFICFGCCFSHSYSQRTDEHGGNGLRVKNMKIQAESISIFQCGYSATCGGDSTIFLTSCIVSIDAANSTHNIGKNGASLGCFRDSTENEVSHMNLLYCSDHNMCEIWNGQITIVHANFVNNNPTQNQLYARSATDRMFISDAYFSENNGFAYDEYVRGDVSRYNLTNCYGTLYGFVLTPSNSPFDIQGLPNKECVSLFFTKTTKAKNNIAFIMCSTMLIH